MLKPSGARSRETIFISHAAPEDNEFALWVSSKLAMAGYNVWIDRRRLLGGSDFWDEIDHVLRSEAVKQIVVFTPRIVKAGVKKELAIGDILKGRLSDPNFMIPIRADEISFSDAPPEFIRGNILNAFPDWHDCLQPLFETLEAARVPRMASPQAELLRQLIAIREEGRRFVADQPEAVLTNWFPLVPPDRIRYYRFGGLQEQMKGWLKSCSIPYVTMGRLAGSFADPPSFEMAGATPQRLDIAHDIGFADFVGGADLGPYLDRPPALNDVVNLLRQHFDLMARARGLKPVEFGSGATGWFFPDNLIPGNRIAFTAPDGRRIRRTVTGKFKRLRWHLCLIAKPRIWPEIVYRIHGNVVLTEDGKLLDGEKTHLRRRRLTRSWWNDVWRDRLLVALRFLADDTPDIVMAAGDSRFRVLTWPLSVEVPVSYEATDPPLPSEEDDDGTIIPSAALDDLDNELEVDDAAAGTHEEAE
jgi:hypothetical protein